MKTRETIDKYYADVNKADWDSWLILFHNDAVVDEPIVHLEGIDAIKGVVNAIKKGYSKFYMHPQRIFIDGAYGCVLWRCEAANINNVPIDAKGVNVFRVENGKITRLDTFFDTVPFAPFLNQKLAD